MGRSLVSWLTGGMMLARAREGLQSQQVGCEEGILATAVQRMQGEVMEEAKQPPPLRAEEGGGAPHLREGAIRGTVQTAAEEAASNADSQGTGPMLVPRGDVGNALYSPHNL